METLSNSDERIIIDVFKDMMVYSQGVKRGDGVMIINRNHPTLSLLAHYASQEIKTEPEKYYLKIKTAYREYPKELHSILKRDLPKATIGFYNYSGLPENAAIIETPARVSLIRDTLLKIPTGTAHCPGIDIDMILNGAGRCSSEELNKIGKKPLDILNGTGDEKVEYLHMTSDAGTDMRFEIPNEIVWQPDYKLKPPGVYGDEKGVLGNFPWGEIFAQKEIGEKSIPIKADGYFVCNVCVGNLEKLVDPDKPIEFVVENGEFKRHYSRDSYFHNKIEKITRSWEQPIIVAELGIGLNRYARKTGNLLEDEKLMGTAHIALEGEHMDVLTDKPTIKAYLANGSEKIIMKNGKLY